MQYKDPESGNDKSLLLAARRSLTEALEAEGPVGSLQGAHLLMCHLESDLASSARAAARRSAVQAEQELASWQAPALAQKSAGQGSDAPVAAIAGGRSQDTAAESRVEQGGGLMMPPGTVLTGGAALLRASQPDGRGQEGKAQPSSSAPLRQQKAADQGQRQRNSGAAGARGPKQQSAEGQQPPNTEAGAGAPAWTPKDLSFLTRRALHLWPACTPLRGLLGQTQRLPGAA